MVLRAATKDENVPRPRTLIMVAARDRGRDKRYGDLHAANASATPMIFWLKVILSNIA